MDLINEPLTEKGKQTVEALLTSAQNSFYEKGYQKTTIKDITSDAGVSVGAFYLYFEDKYSLYKHLVERYGKFIREEVRKRTGSVKNRKEAERNGLIAFIELVRENPDIYNILWESIYIDKNIFFNYYREFAESYIRQLTKSEKKHEIVFDDVEVLAYMLIGMNTFLGVRYGMMDSDVDVEHVADNFIDILTNGIFRKN